MAKEYERPVTVRCGGPRGGSFRVKLTMCGNGVDNHVLLITLNVWFQQVSPSEKITASDGGVFNVQAWDTAGWDKFKERFIAVGRAFWHQRFCLIPPAHETQYLWSDWKPFTPKYMPNIECHLDIRSVTSNHDVIVRAAKFKPDDPGRGQYSTHATPGTMQLQDGDVESSKWTAHNPVTLEGVTVTQYAAAHELGHVLGQPHIGALKSTPACMKALAGSTAWQGSSEDEKYYLENGHGSWACYGYTGEEKDRSLVENIMGGGTHVEDANSITWRKALVKLLEDKDADLPSDWKVRLQRYVGPALISS